MQKNRLVKDINSYSRMLGVSIIALFMIVTAPKTFPKHFTHNIQIFFEIEPLFLISKPWGLITQNYFTNKFNLGCLDNWNKDFPAKESNI